MEPAGARDGRQRPHAVAARSSSSAGVIVATHGALPPPRRRRAGFRQRTAAGLCCSALSHSARRRAASLPNRAGRRAARPKNPARRSPPLYGLASVPLCRDPRFSVSSGHQEIVEDAVRRVRPFRQPLNFGIERGQPLPEHPSARTSTSRRAPLSSAAPTGDCFRGAGHKPRARRRSPP